jgi:uncharacterized protein (DUF885 family)
VNTTLARVRHVVPGLLASGLLMACSTAPAPKVSGGPELLESLIGQYAEAQGSHDGRDPIFTPASFESDIAGDRALLQKLQMVGTQGLSIEQLNDHDYLIGVLETDIRRATVRRRWENDPAMYVPSRQLGLLLDPDAVESAEERADKLARVLSSLEANLDQGRANLANPPERFTQEAIFQVESTLATLKKGKPSFSELPVMNALGQADVLLGEYLNFLRDDLLPRSTGDWAIGKSEYDYILSHRWFLQSDADEILARGYQAFEQTEALAQEIAERIEPGKHWTEVYEGLKDDHPESAQIKQAYQEQMDAAGRFIREHQIVTLPEGERVVTIDTPPAMRRSSPFGTFQSVGAFDEGLEGRLILTPIEPWMSEEQQQARLRSHHQSWIPVIAVHEAYPGHHVHALKTRENPRILRKIAREPIFSEGWGLFTEELMFELGFLQGDDVRLTQLRNRLWRAARVILDSSLHTGKMTVDEAVNFLVEKVRFEPYAAELEVGMYVRRPTYVLGYLIGMQELMSIRSDYIEEFGKPSPPSEFYDRLLSIGSIPPALVRRELLGRSTP